jgi:hypothetical protein
MRPAPSIETLEPRRFLSTYYVSDTGNDSLAGTSTATPWRTVKRVNTQKLKAGDKVLFQGGKSFSGGLLVPAGEGGTSAAPVTFSTYGSGRATINSGSLAGFEIIDTLGVSISNLRFVGSTAVPSKIAAGIWVHTAIANKSLSFLRISNCEVKNYGFEGIGIGVPIGSGATINDVGIDHSDIHGNKYGGIIVTGTAGYANKNYTFDHLRVYDNPGNPQSNGPLGSGIYLANVDTALVQRCVVYNNGAAGAAPVGMWAAGSTRVTFQYNEAYNNHTRTTTDGGGFNFDWDTTNSTMQYNYSHGNDGPAFLLGAGLARQQRQRHPLQHQRKRRPQERPRRHPPLGQRLQRQHLQQRRLHAVHRQLRLRRRCTSTTSARRQSAEQRPDPQQRLLHHRRDETDQHHLAGARSHGQREVHRQRVLLRRRRVQDSSGATRRSTTASPAGEARPAQEKLNGVSSGFQGDPKSSRWNRRDDRQCRPARLALGRL